MSYLSAQHCLQQVFGYDAFRGEQEAIVNHVISGGDALVLMPTGGGKSLCYQLPALLRDGVAIVISPLIALMQDQVDTLQQLGVAAAFLNSSLDIERANFTNDQLMQGNIKILYVAPERLRQATFYTCWNNLTAALGLPCLQLMKRTVFHNGGMISDRNTASSPCCMSIFRMCLVSR